jgi:3-hydroxypropanoate dehydrogenase
MTNPIPDSALAQVFIKARTHSYWQETPVSDSLLKQVYDLAKMGPTSANCSPMRVLFVKSKEAKERLKPFLAEGNIEKTMNAPVTAIIAADPAFYEQLPELYPHADARSWFAGNAGLSEETSFRNSSMQGAYFIMAARAMGLDCGPMSGFDKAGVDQAFFAESGWKSNFLCNLGHGVAEKLHPRSPRLSFEKACKIL